ncbi:hypothetical protein TNCV_4323181 [Trichonephila clavipes]|nr:hypothetical protein TNCV_4323181 [Trichonephila clavipes]
MAPHKPRKSTPEQDSEDEDMIEYNPDEFDPDDYVQKYYNIGEYKSVITPTCYKNLKNSIHHVTEKKSLNLYRLGVRNRPTSDQSVSTWELRLTLLLTRFPPSLTVLQPSRSASASSSDSVPRRIACWIDWFLEQATAPSLSHEDGILKHQKHRRNTLFIDCN